MGNLKRIVFGILAMLVMVTSVNAETTITSFLESKYCTDDNNKITCNVYEDITLGETLTVADKELVINIEDGKTLKLNTVDSTTEKTVILVKDGGKLTINGGKVDATGISSQDGRIVKVTGNGEFTLNSTINASDTVVDNSQAWPVVQVYDSAKVNLTESSVITGYITGFSVSYTGGAAPTVDATLAGTIDTTANAVAIHGNVKTGTVKIDVKPTANIKSDYAAVYAAGTANWKIEGGTFEGKDALSIKSGTFVIDDGDFHANGGQKWNPTASAGAELTGAAISITSNNDYAGNVSLTINNGTFKSDSFFAVYRYKRTEANDSLTKIEINGGNFTANNEEVIVFMNDNAVRDTSKVNFIKGGVFTTTKPNVDHVSMNPNFYGQVAVGTDSKGNMYIGEQAEALHKATVVADLNVSDGLSANVIKGLEFNFDEDTDLTLVAGEVYNLTNLMFKQPLSQSTLTGLAGYTITYKVSYTLDDEEHVDTYTKKFVAIAPVALLRIALASDEFVMPAADIKIEASIAKTIDLPTDVSYNLTVENSENGTVTVDKETAKEGETVTITVTPKDGYEVSKVLVNGQETGITKNEDGTYSFVMAAADAKVSVEFTAKDPENNPEAGGQETETGKGDENNNTGSTNENQNTTENKTDEIIDKNSPTLDSIVSIVTLAISSLGTAGYSIKKFIRK